MPWPQTNFHKIIHDYFLGNKSCTSVWVTIASYKTFGSLSGSAAATFGFSKVSFCHRLVPWAWVQKMAKLREVSLVHTSYPIPGLFEATDRDLDLRFVLLFSHRWLRNNFCIKYIVIAETLIDKGHLILKWFLRSWISSKKRTN